MKTETWNIDKLTPYARNPRKNDGAVDKVAASLKEFGWRQPIVVDAEGVIIAGHTRYKAARKLGMDKVPVHIADGLTPAQIKAYRIADNKVGELAEWDMELLALEVEDLKLEDYPIDLTGFDLDELPGGSEDVDVDAEPQTDKAEELRVKWGVEPGQLWELGEHRILCGDSTKKEDVERCLGGVKPLLMVTDPPYGVEYDPSWRADAGVNKNKDKMGKVANDDVADWSPAWRLFDGDAAYVYHAGVMSSTVQASLELCGFKIRAQVIWAKDRMALSRGDYHWQHEPCWYAVREGKPGHRTDDRTQTTLWSIPARDDSGHGHGTQKPVECMARPIRNHDSEFVYEPFSGSGTTIIACEQLGRKCRAIEISPGYVAVALQRWADATGKTPKLVE
jgi:DNA modification methylase